MLQPSNAKSKVKSFRKAKCFRQGNFLLDVHLRYSCCKKQISAASKSQKSVTMFVQAFKKKKLKLQAYILFFRIWLRVEWYCDSMRARHAHVDPTFWKRLEGPVWSNVLTMKFIHLGPGPETRITRWFWDNSLYQLWRSPKKYGDIVVRLWLWFTLAFPWLSIGFSIVFHGFQVSTLKFASKVRTHCPTRRHRIPPGLKASTDCYGNQETRHCQMTSDQQKRRKRWLKSSQMYSNV